VISYKAPELCQAADEDLLLQMGKAIFRGFVSRDEDEGGLRLWVAGKTPNKASGTKAEAKFQTLLGILRAWRSGAGEVVDERRGGLGQDGAARDDNGTQYLTLRPVAIYVGVGDEVRSHAKNAALAIKASQNIRNALWLSGRTNRTAADFYMIHEYAEHDLGGKKGITAKLGISGKQQDNLTQSANNLSPLAGGRHARGQKAAPWTLKEQEEFTADMLRRWISHLAGPMASAPGPLVVSI
jgi:hypothetical protein